MLPRYRHTPVFDSERKRCPVCNLAVYSVAGIHPQCAIKRADALEASSRRQAASEADSSAAAIALGTDNALKATGESF